MQNNRLPDGLHPDTLAVRAGQVRTGFEETSEPLFLNSGYVYSDAVSAEAAFAGEIDRFVYSRYANPTVDMFEKRLAAIEGAEAAYATASGMAAVFVALSALCANGSRLVASRSLFGSCYVICNEILPRWGVETVFVDGKDLDQWREALSKPTDAVFFETPSNPTQELVDVRAVCDLAHEAGATVVVDNVFATPLLQRPLELGADVVAYSATKHMDGQGRVLGGAICGTEEFIGGPVKNLMRHAGPGMSPFNAWILLKGLETMPLRVQRMNDSAFEVAKFLENHPAVESVTFPMLDSHPQAELARAQMSGGGSVVTFALKGDTPEDAKNACYKILDAVEVIDISNNLGDAKSLITHPATSTHKSMDPADRAAIGLGDDMLRLSIGLEHVGDLIADLERGLA
ncbi:MAG TPA: O-succinylhomoserine sulfhydrylase [Dietzia timorensis]|uniref:O-succinylhomoserine sulfhydrylase n=1 Tax=Dietzia timorensis TaxID=499555 RepID=A0A921F7C1_9ACTN|nr:O-succinylhomoserine sulfhydrylase [Dietzia timorensis]HJE91763.1 O-succinylhomoserine sulfhydrylase [Dietzia timorensis]